MTTCHNPCTRSTLYPVDHYAAASRAISLVNLLTAQAEGDPQDVLDEVATHHGERGILDLTEACALMLTMVVDDLAGAIDEPVTSTQTTVINLFAEYGEERDLLPLLPKLLENAGGNTLASARAVTETVTAAGANPRLALGLAKCTGMVLRLVECKGERIENLISALEDQMLMLP